MDNLTVYVPAPGKLPSIKQGSGIVGSPMGDRICIDYEGNLYGAVNIVTYGDRVYHAAGRHASQYPTVARLWAQPEDLVEVGVTHQRGVLLTNGLSVSRLTRWLDVDVDELHAQLARTGVIA